MLPPNLRYTKDHEWLKEDGTDVLIGITDFAQRQLGDVVFVELPDVGRIVKQGEAFGTIESVKAVSELYSPVSGEVVAVNPHLSTHPEAVNKTPYETWMIRLKPTTPDETTGLLDGTAYGALIQ